MICKIWHRDSWRCDIGVLDHDDRMTSWHGDVMSVASQRHEDEPHDKISLLLSQTIGHPLSKADCSRLNHIMIVLWTMARKLFYCLWLKPNRLLKRVLHVISIFVLQLNWHWSQNEFLITPPQHSLTKYSKDPLSEHIMSRRYLS